MKTADDSLVKVNPVDNTTLEQGNSPVTTPDYDNFRFDAFQVVILNSLVVPGLVSDHVSVRVRHLRMTVQALDSSMQCPDLEASSGFDKIQDATRADEVRFKRVHDLKPSKVWVWPLD